MAVITGHDGQVDWADIVDSDVAYRTHAWSLDLVGDTHDVTDFTSTGWREFVAGLKGWSGTVELYIDGAYSPVPSDVGSSARLHLYLSDNYLDGTAICTGWHPSVSVDGVETQTLDFQGTSDLTFT